MIYHKPPLYDANEYPLHPENMIQGKGYLDKNDKLPIKDLLKSFKMTSRLQFVTQNLDGELDAYTTAQKQAARIISMIDQESQHSGSGD